jgi:protein gp37
VAVATKSGIEWTDATWNPITGCSKISPGCAHCYAERLSLRFGSTRKPWLPVHAQENVTLHADRLAQPLRWRRPRLIFVNSMSDLFHENVPFSFIEQVFDVMVEADQHVFQILTKRHQRLVELAPRLLWPDNVWMGVSIENRRWAERADALRCVPASIRFISAEPLLGSLADLDLAEIDWLIAGGESGPGHRPVRLEWVRELRDLCRDERVPFFFKQWGGIRSKSGGRSLDGRLHSQLPRKTPRELRGALA